MLMLIRATAFIGYFRFALRRGDVSDLLYFRLFVADA
jgi:hypothetical protein